MLLVIDNYDSFTWNLVDLLRRYATEIKVFRNDELSVRQLMALRPKGILLSPGPGRPVDSGICLELLRAVPVELPVLGVCMGMQAMAEASGGRLKLAFQPMHGRVSGVSHDGKGLFLQVPNPTSVMRYHSLVVDPDSLDSDWVHSARTAEGELMGMRHKEMSWEAVQFHPESILTEDGPQMVRNWVETLKTRVEIR